MWARKEQRLEDHLNNVANLTKYFLVSTPFSDLGWLSGIIHDIGKSTDEWQEYLQKSIYSEENGYSNIQKIDHSSLGAQYTFKYCEDKNIAKIISYVVSGHHSGLLNYDGSPSLLSRLNKELPETNIQYSVNNYSIENFNDPSLFSPQFMIRMLFSSLIDADRIDSSGKTLDNNYNIKEIYNRFFYNLNNMLKNTTYNNLNQYRLEILNQCIDKAKLSNGFFSLTSPTGSGKTLSSTAFGLEHINYNNQNKLIYIVPFLSITEQNAQILRDFTYKDAILEHHSNFDYDRFNEFEKEEIISRAENWNANMIVTTFVQFFESLYKNKPSKCRKLHNIANTTIIMDEVQQIPLEYLKPCITVLKELVNNYNCSVVFCTATQPSFYKSKILTDGIENITHILDNPNYYFDKFKRVEVSFVGKKTNDELINMLDCNKSELIVVNTKKEAKGIASMVDGCYYLTTNLCPQHRRDILCRIKQDLNNNVPCTVVSTSLIEAGIDISFERVFRAITGVDSILQAGGRCNREGELNKLGEVIVYIPENGLPKGKIKSMGQITEKYLKQGYDITSTETINKYFKELYEKYKEKLDKKDIVGRLTRGVKNLDFPFQDVSDDFRLIDQNTYSVVVPYNEESNYMIENIDYFNIRQLQKYVVQVPHYDFEKYYDSGLLEKKKEGIYVLTNKEYYTNMGIEIR